MAEILNIRNPQTLSQKPELQPVRQAMICMHDFLIKVRENRTELTIDDLMAQERVILSGLLALEPWSENSVDQLFNAFWLHKATLGSCTTTAFGIKQFLDTNHPGEYNCKILGTIDYPKLKHFSMHDIVIAKHCLSGTVVGLSPGNIFNKDFTFPEYEGEVFQRSVSLVVGQTEEEVVYVFSKIEGGEVWEDKTGWMHSEPSFNYLDENGERKVVKISEFIKDWEDE